MSWVYGARLFEGTKKKTLNWLVNISIISKTLQVEYMVRNKGSYCFEVIQYFEIIYNGFPTLVVCMMPNLNLEMRARGNQYQILNTLSFIIEIKKYYTNRAHTSNNLYPLPGNEPERLGCMPILESRVVDDIVNAFLRICSGMGKQR